jgi:prophage antirepressor-like protein
MTGCTITPFLYEGEITVRAIDENGREAWVTVDVCRALGVLNAADAVKGLDDDEKGIATIYTLGGPQKIGVVYESGLYALMLKSRKPEAQRFRKWLTSEVLPALRRHGTYTQPSAVIISRPHIEWSLEEWRVKLAKVNSAYRTFNRATAAWVWENEGMPMPPANLLPGWWQGNLLG